MEILSSDTLHFATQLIRLAKDARHCRNACQGITEINLLADSFGGTKRDLILEMMNIKY
jgi:hypothetical protein